MSGEGWRLESTWLMIKTSYCAVDLASSDGGHDPPQSPEGINRTVRTHLSDPSGRCCDSGVWRCLAAGRSIRSSTSFSGVTCFCSRANLAVAVLSLLLGTWLLSGLKGSSGGVQDLRAEGLRI